MQNKLFQSSAQWYFQHTIKNVDRWADLFNFNILWPQTNDGHFAQNNLKQVFLNYNA